MKRRTVIRSGAAVLIGGGLWALWRSGCGAYAGVPGAMWAGDATQSYAYVGRRAVEQGAEGFDPRSVAARLEPVLVRSGSMSDPQATKDALRRQVRDDFANRRLAKVDGWVLARAEVDVCVAVYLGLLTVDRFGGLRRSASS